MVSIRDLICSWCFFLLAVAKEINLPLMTHLWVSQSVMGVMSGEKFSLK